MRTTYILVGGKASPGLCSEIWEMGRAACSVAVGAFCQGGDSGASVFINEGHPATLTFAGARNGLEDLTEPVPVDVNNHGGHRRIAGTSVS